MSNNNTDKVGDVHAYIIEGTNKHGKPFTAVQFGVITEQGEYLSDLNFPSSLEINLVCDAIEGRQ